MLKNSTNNERTCSVDGIFKENDVVQLVVDGISWNSRVENVSFANLGLLDVSEPVLPMLAEQIRLSTPNTKLVLIVKSKESLRLIHAIVVGTGTVGINTIKLKVNEVETIQRRSAPRAKATLPISIRKTGSRNWARTKSIDINTEGLRIKASGSSDMESGQMLDVAITRLGSVPIVFGAQVVECKNEYGQVAKTHMMRLSIDNIDTQNWQALYRLVQPRLEQATYKSWSA